jgi:hypothetical protein
MGMHKIQAKKNDTTTNNFNTTLDKDLIFFLIESLIRYDNINENDPHWMWVKEKNPKIKASDLLKLLKSVCLSTYYVSPKPVYVSPNRFRNHQTSLCITKPVYVHIFLNRFTYPQPSICIPKPV